MTETPKEELSPQLKRLQKMITMCSRTEALTKRKMEEIKGGKRIISKTNKR